MRKLGWFAVSAVVVTVIAASVLLLAANLYVQSQGAQQRIRQTLSDALRCPVSLTKTTVTPWEGLRLDGITLQPPVPPDVASDQAGSHFLTADSFRVSVAWWPLLTRREVRIDEILLDHPRLSWAQDANGRWMWPGSPPTPHHKKSVPKPDASASAPPASPAAAPDSSANQPPVQSAQVPNPSPEDVEPNPPANPQDHPVLIEKFRIRHGTLEFLNEHRKLLGRFEEVNVDGKLLDEGHAAGEFHFQRATFARAGLQLMNFRSGFNYDETEGLAIDDGKGELAGGVFLTDYKLHPRDSGSPFSAKCRVGNVDLSRLIREAGSPLQIVEGRLQGEMAIEGMSDDAEQRKAAGQLRLVGARLKNFPVLQLLGEVLRIEDLEHLQFKKAEVDCTLDGNDLEISPINLISNDLQVWAQGRYSAGDDQLALHGKLVIDQAVGHQLPQFIEMNFTPCGDEAPGSRYIEFDVTGPLNKPSTNLFDKILAGPTNGLLQNLLAPKPKKPRNKGPKLDTHAPPTSPETNGNGS